MCAIDITAEQRKTVLALLARHLPNTTAWVYGSRVKWTSRPESDLDLVVFAKPEQERRVSDLREAFEESNLPFRVDLFVWDTVPEQFRKTIEAERVVLVEREELRVGSEWVHCTRADACSAINYGLTASASNDAAGPKFLRITDIVSGQLDWNTVPHVVADKDSIAKYRLYDGDIVIARTGASTGTSLYIKPPPRAVFASYLVRLQAKPDFNARFLAYYLKSKEFGEFIRGVLGDKSAQPNASASTMTAVPLSAPRDRTEQRAIAHVLGTLDDKIELNRRMNQTLEEMARALFKSWFVDFDPVRANATLKHHATTPPQGGSDWSGKRARTYLDRMDPDITALFPDSFVDSEHGPIPEGWEVKALGKCFNLTMGQSPPGSTYNEQGEGLPFFQGRSDFGFRYPENRKFCAAPTRIAQSGDTLVSVRAPVGDINMAWEICCIGRGVAALRHKSGTMSFSYYSAWTIQAALREYEQTGTVFGAINKSQFEALQVIAPSPSIVDAFDSSARPLDEKIRSNIAESRTLAALRDSLLPKLVSGRLRVNCLTASGTASQLAR